jgi:hypothetical protein
MPQHNDIEELKLLIAHNLDVIELLDILGISFPELLDILEDQIEDEYQELHRACE